MDTIFRFMTVPESLKNNHFLKIERSNSKVTDEEVWLAFQNDSTVAFKHLYHVYVDSLYSYGKKLTPAYNFVEDVIQDMFIDLWNSRHRLGEVTNVKAYLFVSFRRRLLHVLKKNNKYPVLVKLSDVQDIQDTMDSDQESSYEKVTSILKNLPERQQEAIFLRFQSGLSCQEIAKILNINSQSVYNLIHKAIKSLRTSALSLIFLIVLVGGS
jgi:RNA polymerase sigma factor (sigma-70 family)